MQRESQRPRKGRMRNMIRCFQLQGGRPWPLQGLRVPEGQLTAPGLMRPLGMQLMHWGLRPQMPVASWMCSVSLPALWVSLLSLLAAGPWLLCGRTQVLLPGLAGQHD